MRTFVVEHPVAGRLILVAEPTSARAVVAHRGIGTATVTFNGIGGHASLQRASLRRRRRLPGRAALLRAAGTNARPAQRQIVHRVGAAHNGLIRNLFGPRGLGEQLKPFVSFDHFSGLVEAGFGFPLGVILMLRSERG